MKHSAKKWILLLGVLISAPAQALDVQLFRPNFDQQGGIVVQNAQTMPRLSFAPGVFINWVRNPIEFGLTNDTRTDTLVGWFATLDLLLAAGITDDLSVGINMPFNLGSQIEAISTALPATTSSIGDLNFYAKYRLRSHSENLHIIPAIAIVPFITLPTGDDGVFFGNDQMSGGFKLAFDWILSNRQSLSFNVGPRFRETDNILNLRVGHELLAGLGYSHLIWEKHQMSLIAELYGSTTFAKFLTEEISSPLELLVGLKKPWLNEKLSSTFGIGRGGNNGYGAPDVRIFAGMAYQFAGPKSKPDSDSDGLKDDRDACPNQPEDFDQFEDENGCPDPDNDKDGIVDSADQCPLEPEVINGVKDEDGCPDEGQSKVKIEGSKFILLDKVYFATNKDEILPKSNDVLNQVVATLKANPEITKLRVEGHTDDRGADAWNLDLSKRRAKRVREYLLSQGIDSDRIESEGYGETQPIDTNATAAGRDNNRRVEFNIVSQQPSAKLEQPVEKKTAKQLEKTQQEEKVAQEAAIQAEIKSEMATIEKPVVKTPAVVAPIVPIVQKPSITEIPVAIEPIQPKLNKKELRRLEKQKAAELAAAEKAQLYQIEAEETAIRSKVAAETPVVVEEPKLTRKERKRLEKEKAAEIKAIEKTQREQIAAEKSAEAAIKNEMASVEKPLVKTPTAKAAVVVTPAVVTPVVETPVVVAEPKLSKKELRRLEKEKVAEIAAIEKVQREQVAEEEAVIKSEMVAEKPTAVEPIVETPIQEPKLTRKERKRLEKERASEIAAIEKVQREQMAAEKAVTKTEVVDAKIPVVETPVVTPSVVAPVVETPAVIEEPKLTRNELKQLEKKQQEQKAAEEAAIKAEIKNEMAIVEQPAVKTPVVASTISPKVEKPVSVTPVVETPVGIEEPKLSKKEQKRLEKQKAAELEAVEKAQLQQMESEESAIRAKIVADEPVVKTPIVAAAPIVVEEPKLSKKELRRLEKEKAAELAVMEAPAATPVVVAPVVPSPVVIETPKLTRREIKRLEKERAAEIAAIEKTQREQIAAEKAAEEAAIKAEIKNEMASVEKPVVKTPTAKAAVVVTPAVVTPVVETPVVVAEPKLSKKELRRLEKEKVAEIAAAEKAQLDQIEAEETAIRAKIAAETPAVEKPVVETPVVVEEPKLTRKERRRLKKAQREQTALPIAPQPVDPIVQTIEEIMSKVIQFPTNKSRFYRAYIIELNQVVDLLKKNPEIKMMMIEGHADSRGPEKYNMVLSEKRAEQVRQHFIRSGISPDRLGTLGYGESSPIDTSETSEAWARNRRVEFIIQKS